MDEMKRYQLMTEVLEGKIYLTEAAQLLALSYRQSIRIKQSVQAFGLEGVLRKAPSQQPNLRITESIKEEIMKHRETYYDFNIEHFREKLEEWHEIKLSHESLRQILIKAGDHQPKKKKQVYRKRRRMPRAGMLVQMDTSEHCWIESIKKRWSLIATIDDASGKLTAARFFSRDTTFNNMHVIRRVVETNGIFKSLYVDKASHFTTTRHGGLHVEISQDNDDTQIERALEELGVTLIPANSPQAKGRVERLFRTLQDRLIKEMRLAGIANYDDANLFLEEVFLPWYNERYTYEVESIYSTLPETTNLDLVFSIKHIRTVAKDHTIQILGHTIQIPPTQYKLSIAKHKVTVCEHQDNRVTIIFKDKVITALTLTKDTKTKILKKKCEEALAQRSYEDTQPPKIKKYSVTIPKPNHPWRNAAIIQKQQKHVKELVMA